MSVTIKFKSNSEDGSAKRSYDDALEASKTLSMASHPDQIAAVLTSIAQGQFSHLERETLIQTVQYKTKLPKQSLRLQLKVFEQELGLLPNDFALEIARTIRNQHFNGGAHLLRSVDGFYWRFVGTHWEVTDRGELRKLLLEAANKVFHLYDGSSLSTLVNQAWACLDDLLGTANASFSARTSFGAALRRRSSSPGKSHRSSPRSTVTLSSPQQSQLTSQR